MERWGAYVAREARKHVRGATAVLSYAILSEILNAILSVILKVLSYGIDVVFTPSGSRMTPTLGEHFLARTVRRRPSGPLVAL